MQYTQPSPLQPDPPLSKIGLYTSPHLRFVRERIQINHEPLSEEVFAKYFFEVWDRLEDAARAKGEPTDKSAKPVYFRFLTLMAFHTYMSEGVDTAIIECGIGGEYDSTNVLVKPSVTGITSLGIDHTAMLGNTIEEIAWHKGGIMKQDVPCYTSPQPTTALDVLQKRSTETSCPLTTPTRHPALSTIELGLAADFQQTNASLAIAIAWHHLFLTPHNPNHPLPTPFIHGLERVRWPGRCETRREGNIAWHIDGGHTLESIEVAGTWFASQVQPPTTINNKTNIPPPSPQPTKPPRRILLFNQQTRDANALAKALYTTLASALQTPHPFTHAVFCTNTTFTNSGYRPDLVSVNTSKEAVGALEVQRGLAETWGRLDGEAVVVVKRSVEEAVGWSRGVARGGGEGDGEEGVDGVSAGGDEGAKRGKGEVKVLVTGSVHLVGGFFEVLESGEVDGVGKGLRGMSIREKENREAKKG